MSNLSIVIVIVLLITAVALGNTLHSSSAQSNTTMNSAKRPIAVLPSGIISPFANITTSIPVFPTLMKALKPEIHVSLNNAITIAMKALGSNSSAISASLKSTRGFLVYRVIGVDANDFVHLVMVDPGNGRVVSNQLWSNVVIGNSIMGLTPTITGIR